jgi:hypothetical protein
MGNRNTFQQYIFIPGDYTKTEAFFIPRGISRSGMLTVDTHLGMVYQYSLTEKFKKASFPYGQI